MSPCAPRSRSRPRSLRAPLRTAAATWWLTARRDRRRIQADPERLRLIRPLDGRSDQVESPDGTVLHTETFGPEDAQPVVLIHGWTCDHTVWVNQINDLSEDFRVIAYHLRGHGRSTRPAGDDFSIQAHAADLSAVLARAMKRDARAVLVGHSLGAMTIAAWAKEHPDDVQARAAAAVLVNTGLGDLISESLVVRTPKRLDAAKGVLGRALLGAAGPLPPATPISHRVVRHVALSSKATPAQMDFSERMVLACHHRTRAGCGRTLTELDLVDGLHSLAVPAAVVAGTHDRLTPPAHARRMADALPGHADLIELPTGHMGPIEAPDEVSATIARAAARAERDAPSRLRVVLGA